MNGMAASSAKLPQGTAGDLSVLNLQSSLQRAWEVLKRWPDRPGTVERILEEEQIRAQFLGDVAALDRLTSLASEQCLSRPGSAATHIVAAQVASILHRFTDAKTHLADAEACGAPAAVTHRAWLAVKQALGEDLPEVLVARRQIAETSAELQELVSLGALLAELGEFEEAERSYAKAFQQYRDVSPFALGWVCFQLGLLWGEMVPQPQLGRAANWYERAIDYLPAYIGARVHLAEIYLNRGDLEDAEALLAPAIGSGDPEVNWRLAQVMEGQARLGEARVQLNTARSAFENLLARHELAFADHAAEFYLSSGADPTRACDLSRLNLANRPTLRGFELAYAAAVRSGEEGLASEFLIHARTKFASTKAFTYSPLAGPVVLRSHTAAAETHI
jgi:tetratricopeptide (TPR) repeat protein